MSVEQEDNMTRAEFYEKYGQFPVKFSSYYKYIFTYSGALPDGGSVECDCGGDAGEIYRHSVTPDTKELINTLQPYAGRAMDKDGVIVDNFYDY